MTAPAPMRKGRPSVDVTGQVFGELTAVRRVGTAKNKSALWLFSCSCGASVETSVASVRHFGKRSCGCRPARPRPVMELRDRYPLAYMSWFSLRGRCSDPEHPRYADYGGRGIRVLWQSFAEFVADMGERPSRDHSIDRINNDGHYERSNCRWATVDVQARNTRRTRRISLDGRVQCVTDWARELGVSRGAVLRSVAAGLSLAQIQKKFTPRYPT